MKRIVFVISCFAVLSASAQKTWTLEECIEYAYKNNLNIKQRELDIKTSEINLKEAKMATLPSLNASASHGYNFGRSIDPFTNQFVVKQISNSQFSLSSGVILFNGFQILNNIKVQQQMLRVSQFDLEVSRNDIGLSIANAYLQILFARELVNAADERIRNQTAQLERTRRFREAGRVPENAVLELTAQLANEELSKVQAVNQLNIANLTLWQLLDIPPAGNEVVVPQVDTVTGTVVKDPQELYDAYKVFAPELLSAETRLQAGELSWKVARGAFYPRLTLGANVNTVYSENFRQGADYITFYQQYFVSPSGPSYYQPISTPTSFTVTPFGEQLSNNLGQTVGLSLTVPIFNNYRTLASVKRASINLERSRIGLQQAKNNVYRQINQAYTEYIAAQSTYAASNASYDAMKRSFEYAQARFDANALSSADFNIQQNNFAQSQTNLLRAKYEYLFRTKIIEFYRTGKVRTEISR